MLRFRRWVGGLHGGQMALLVPMLLVMGALVWLGTVFVPIGNEAGRRLGEAKADLGQHTADQKFDREGAIAAGYSIAEIDAYLQEQRQKQRPESLALAKAMNDATTEYERARAIYWAVVWCGALVCFSLWITAFLSLWWWFGARAKGWETT